MSAPTAPEALVLWNALGPTFTGTGDEPGSGTPALVTALTAGLEPLGVICRNPAVWWDPAQMPDSLVRHNAGRAGLSGAHGQSVERLRDRLANPPAFEDGSSEAIAEAVRGVLTRTDPDEPAFVRVFSHSRPDTSEFAENHTTVVVRPAQVVDVTEEQIIAAAEQGAPGWKVIHVVIGITWAELAEMYDTWAEAAAAYPDWASMAGEDGP